MDIPPATSELKQKDDASLLFKISEIHVVKKLELTIKDSWGKVPLATKYSEEKGTFKESTPSCLTAVNKYLSLGIGIDQMLNKSLV